MCRVCWATAGWARPVDIAAGPEDPDVLRLRAPSKIQSLVIGRDARANATDSGGTQCGENGILPLDTL
jgi:hypothetical protein